ncbi:coilin isoform X2 [Helianthus annuus]|uniref:coilin isoform X2 n=1 Tax=Helianthus annuus TaxID=4232 RepID=UPI000B9083D7|nr:coilin isoform X2 [Helianthus annuus]
MGTPSVRVRLVFEDRSILTKTQRSDGMNNTWLLLKLQQHPTIADVCTHLLRIFNLRRSCPNGILLSMEGFALPSFESTEILKDKEIICVKRKGGSTPNACNLLDDVLESEDDSLLHLGKDNRDNGTKEYQSESEEEQSLDEEQPEETILKKRKASSNLQNLNLNRRKKKLCLAALGDDEDEAETEEIENISKKKTKKMATTSNRKVKAPSTVKRSEELQGNVEEVNQVTNAPGPKKGTSATARRRKAKRKRELAKITKKKPKQAFSKPEITKPKNKEVDDQPKGLLYWKQASKTPLQNGDMGTDVGSVVNRPTHIRFESLDEDETVKQTAVSIEKINCSSGSKETGQQCGRNDHSKQINQESCKTLFKDSKVPVIDPNDFDKLPPCCEPKEGDVIAYRLLELSSSWIAELSSFRVGRISFYDAKDIVLVPVTEYPIVTEKINEDGSSDSLYGEDGTLKINYSALVDVRNVKQCDPNAIEPLSDGVDQTPMSDAKDAAENLVFNGNHNMDVPKDSNPDVNPWDRTISKNTVIPEPNNQSTIGSGMNPSVNAGAGPSTCTGLDVNKAESSVVKEGQNGNSIDPWLSANKPGSSQENNSGWSNVLGPTANHCENGSSWGRPWSAFVVSKSSSVIQQNGENEWRVGSSRGSWKPMWRGAPRGRGRGREGSRGRGRGRNSN